MKVRLSPYTDAWKLMFTEEEALLQTIFGKAIMKIEHFGSTAIPGMKAKPVIDMMCMVHDIAIIDTYNERMKSLGYDVAGEWGIEGRRLFRKGGENRTHHIHFYSFDHPEIERHLVFRDYLLAHPQQALRYSQFKESLAQKYESTSEYSVAKKPFVSAMEKTALVWYQQEKNSKP
ncbi:GrpB family protein [Longirhabdus pacifica]|uniref:GrpB family protein n=1 Tax=Longirhabdus pacifica TaxID=2305227 RepID=UPI0010090F1B|nr:GrpB family protein [Longirhabdus pacifica]